MKTARLPTVSRKEALILDLLALVGSGEMYGLELVEASDGQLKRGTVYVTLGRMEDKGYVVSVQEVKPPGAIGLPRRMYRLTPLGKRAREAWALVSRKLAWENA
jgi:PadR family transcriptional regulator